MKNPALLEEIKTYRGRDEVPEDFDAFWDGEVKNVSTLPSYHLEERDFHISQVKCYELTPIIHPKSKNHPESLP
ncbi:acetyl xylan esterase [Streptococcus pneumoniae]|nr:acetyl xylan esterase [Streptococcus pneumoniae]VPH21592.1 acetyl xylan esterase [Streptococcus pneumoniae]VRY72272.1 acetyl xylan esterase [Streptococcus pneumoniae]